MGRVSLGGRSAMSNSLPWIVQEFQGGVDEEQVLDFRDLLEVSDSLATGYLKLVRGGAPKRSVGIAMLYATVNVFDLVDMRAELPVLLRRLAKEIESDFEVGSGDRSTDELR